jgi:2'-5' RNA ligase
MPRLFTAVEVPRALTERLAELRPPLAGAKWIEAEDMHITLRFVGDIDNRAADEFCAALAAVDEPAFELRLAAFGVFGGREPRSLWAGVEENRWLDTLARANDRAARVAGLPPDKRAFRPHVTLARLRGAGQDAVAEVLGQLGNFRSESFPVDRFVLLSSRPKTGGGPYVVEEAFPLRGGADVGPLWVGEDT